MSSSSISPLSMAMNTSSSTTSYVYPIPAASSTTTSTSTNATASASVASNGGIVYLTTTPCSSGNGTTVLSTVLTYGGTSAPVSGRVTVTSTSIEMPSSASSTATGAGEGTGSVTAATTSIGLASTGAAAPGLVPGFGGFGRWGVGVIAGAGVVVGMVVVF